MVSVVSVVSTVFIVLAVFTVFIVLAVFANPEWHVNMFFSGQHYDISQTVFHIRFKLYVGPVILK